MTPQRDTANGSGPSFHRISVIVPANPFIRDALHDVRHCLAALDVVKLMDWWPGKPYFPHRNPDKVNTIQRSLDWKRVAQIAAYLLQREIVGAPEKIEQYFGEIYGTTVGEPGREWPPRLPKVARFQRSGYPTFSNVLLHVNGAKLDETSVGLGRGVANLVFDENSSSLDFCYRWSAPHKWSVLCSLYSARGTAQRRMADTSRDFYRFGQTRRTSSTSSSDLH